MNFARLAFEKSTFITVLAVMLTVFGILAFNNLGRLEDPEYTIKTAFIITPYPGATPLEVEEEVTEVIEQAIKSMGEIKEISSYSQSGVSYVFATIKEQYSSTALPQIWDKLRKKIRDARGSLPPGAGAPVIKDDFGDAYGVFFALHGRDHSFAQLKDYAKYLKKELLLCQDVAKIDFWGVQPTVIYIEFKQARIAQQGVFIDNILHTLSMQNVVEPSGMVEIGSKYIAIRPTGNLNTEQKIADLLIAGQSGNMIRLGEIATIHRDYADPPRSLMRHNGKPAIGIGISTVKNGDAVLMGRAVKEKIRKLTGKKPRGMELDTIYYQSEVVTQALNVFLLNLAQAVAIVIILLLFFMGLRSGLIIGVVLLLTILGTFIGMLLTGIDLQKISLGTLILALGMLVDNAIVIADGILVRITGGENRKKAAGSVVQENAWPLLGATSIAILAFAAISFAPGETGEYCRSLFDVLALALGISWILAITLTPLLCVWFLKPPATSSATPYTGRLYGLYRATLVWCLKYRFAPVLLTLLCLGAAMAGFSKIPQNFFPPSTQKYFYVNYWKPQGEHIRSTDDDLGRIAAYLLTRPEVENVTEFVGEGALRFVLNYQYQRPNSAYGQLLVKVKSTSHIDNLIPHIQLWLEQNFPDSEPYCEKIMNGPPIEYLVETRFRGPDIDVLHNLAAQALAVMRKNPNTRDVRTNWRHPVQVLRPRFSEIQARPTGATRSDLAKSLQMNFGGLPAGLFRENDELIPIVLRPVASERGSIHNLEAIQVWNSARHTFTPISQLITGIGHEWEDPIICRHDQQRSITVQCNPIHGLAEPLRQSLRAEIEAIKLPPGYTMSWQGEYHESVAGQRPLEKAFPVCALGMFLILVGLFNSIRKPLIIFLTLPLSIIGITGALFVFSMPFGFMAIVGFLGLSGMLIKNAIVLLEQTDLLLKAGSSPYQAVVNAAVSRLRPVTMASGTTMLGMIPLVFEPLFAAMAVTIMGGLMAATFLTLILIPVLYSLAYRIRPE